MTQVLIDFINKKLPASINGGYNDFDIRDVADVLTKVIENARKVMELMDNQSYDIGFIDELEFINKYIRHGEGCDRCEHIFILDCLENDCMLNICKEPFISFVQKLSYNIDRDYLAYIKEMEMYGDSEE
jgi:hypothetical protein